MNPNAVNQNGDQAPRVDDASRSVFGAPLPASGQSAQAAGAAAQAGPVAGPPVNVGSMTSTSAQLAQNASSAADANHNGVINTSTETLPQVVETTDKEWVESARNIVKMTINNPYEKSQKIAALRLQYLAAKFGKKTESDEHKV